MRKLRMLIALVVLPTMMFAQSTTAKLAGVVADADGNPLVGANVVVEGSNLGAATDELGRYYICLLYTSPSPRDGLLSRMPSSA